MRPSAASAERVVPGGGFLAYCSHDCCWFLPRSFQLAACWRCSYSSFPAPPADFEPPPAPPVPPVLPGGGPAGGGASTPPGGLEVSPCSWPWRAASCPSRVL